MVGRFTGPDDITEELRLFRRSTRTFLQRLLPSDTVRDCESLGEIPAQYWTALAEQGLLGVGVPEQWGGSGGGLLEQVVLLEELGRVSVSTAMRYLTSAFSGVATLLRAGTDEQQHQFVRRFVAGELEFGPGLTEPSGGADIRGWTTRAERSVDGWVISGRKTWTTNADRAQRLLVIARTRPPDSGHRGFSLFLVDPRLPGVSIQRISTMGQRALASFEVAFDEVLIPGDAMVGEEGSGFYTLVGSLDAERVLAAAGAIGNAQAAFDDALGYALDRRAFGRPIGQYQAIAHQLADSVCDIESARALTWRTAQGIVSGDPRPAEATMAKYVATEAAFRVVHRGMRILGGYGFATDFDMERRFRDAQIFLTGPISSEMARNFIAESIGLPKTY